MAAPRYGLRRGRVQAIEQRSSGLEITRLEALIESVVDRGKELIGLVGPAVLLPQPSQARGGAQLPRQCVLPARPVECLSVMILGRPDGCG